MRIRCFLLGAAIIVLVTMAPPAGGADSYPKNLDIDVLHYDFELWLSDAGNRIEGVTTIQVRFVTGGVDGFAIDLANERPAEEGTGTPTVGMAVAAVEELRGETVDDEPLPFTHADDRLRISLVNSETMGGTFVRPTGNGTDLAALGLALTEQANGLWTAVGAETQVVGRRHDGPD